MYELVGDLLCKTFDADLVYVAMHDEATDRIEFAYYSEGGRRVAQDGFPMGQGLTSHILRTHQDLLLNREEDWASSVPRASGHRGHSSACRSWSVTGPSG